MKLKLHCRDATISERRIGIKVVVNPTKLEIVSLIRFIVLEKFAIINVTTKIYST
jgi:hypothetical protein